MKFDIYARVYNEIYRHRSISEDVQWLLDSNNLSRQNILDFGAGTGLYAKELARRCGHVLAYDIVKDYEREYANSPVNFITSLDMCPQVEQVTSFFNVFNYLYTKETVEEVLFRFKKKILANKVLIDLLDPDYFEIGKSEKEIEVSLNGQVYKYKQVFDIRSDSTIKFDEIVSNENNIVFNMSNQLKLWNIEELRTTLSSYYPQINIYKPKGINPNQVRIISEL